VSATDRIPAFVPEPRAIRVTCSLRLLWRGQELREGDTKMGIASLNHALLGCPDERPEPARRSPCLLQADLRMPRRRGSRSFEHFGGAHSACRGARCNVGSGARRGPP
jgi:hypothetical protein